MWWQLLPQLQISALKPTDGASYLKTVRPLVSVHIHAPSFMSRILPASQPVCVFLLSLCQSELDAAQHAGTSDDITAPNLKSCCVSKIKPGEPPFFFLSTFEARQSFGEIVKRDRWRITRIFLKRDSRDWLWLWTIMGQSQRQIKGNCSSFLSPPHCLLVPVVTNLGYLTWIFCEWKLYDLNHNNHLTHCNKLESR